MRRRRTALAAAVLAVVAGPALAAYGSGAKVTGLGYTLIDLAPGDGIAPNATFLVDTWAATVTSLFGDGGLNELRDEHRSLGAWSSSASSLAATGASGAGFVLATGGPPRMSALGMASAGNAWDAFQITTWQNISVQLSPRTAMVWTGDYVIDAWADRKAGASGHEEAYSGISFGRKGVPNDSFLVRASANPLYGPATGHQAGQFTFSMTNDSGALYRVDGFISAGAAGGQIAPIPEPSTYALFAAGLAVVGVVTRRRAGRSA